MSTWPWPAPVDDGAARHLTPGLRMPDIELASSAGGTVSLAKLPGRTAIFVYPWTGRPGLANPPDWDDIPGAHGSTPELEQVRDLHTAFTSIRTAVYALSGQDSAHHQELIGRLGLAFPILSDASGVLAQALRLPTFETGGVRYLKRITLCLRDGRLQKAFYPAHPPNTHPREVLVMMTATATRKEEAPSWGKGRKLDAAKPHSG